MTNNDNLEKLLAEILRWIRPAVYPSLDSLMRKEFYKPDGKLDLPRAITYSLTDGKSKAVDIAKRAGISQPTISRLWARWRQLGLAEGAKSRETVACFNLEMFGISIPGIETKSDESDERQQAD